MAQGAALIAHIHGYAANHPAHRVCERHQHESAAELCADVKEYLAEYHERGQHHYHWHLGLAYAAHSARKRLIEAGAEVAFDEVLLVSGDSVKIGQPTVAGAKVTGKVLEQGKGAKIRIFKYKAKSNYRRRQGHRQPFTKVQIEKIEG